MVFEHPNSVLPDRQAIFTALGYAISKGDVPEIRKILTSDHSWLLNEADYSGNTPLVSTHGVVDGIVELIIHESISPLQDLVWRSCGFCWKRVLQCTCETTRAGRLCSSQPMPDSMNMSSYSKGQELISMQTS